MIAHQQAKSVPDHSFPPLIAQLEPLVPSKPE